MSGPTRYGDDANVPPPERSAETPPVDRDVKPENVTAPAPATIESELRALSIEEAQEWVSRGWLDPDYIAWLPIRPPKARP